MYEKQKYVLLKSLKDCNLYSWLYENHAIIAGGAIRAIFAKEQIADYDIYFKKQKDLDEFIYYMNSTEFELSFVTPSARSYKLDRMKIQVITIPELFGSAENIIKQFDYTVCMGAYDFDSGNFILDDRFLEHLSARELFFNVDSQYPLSSLFRMRKYMDKGYKISGIEIVKLGLSINNLKMHDYKELKKQLQGIDTLFLKELTDKLMTPEYADREYDFKELLELLDTYQSEKLDTIFE